ncbi:MAG: hypothetical protein ACJ72Q_07640 [Nitrososphaeraceae archaeon]
MPPPLPFGLYEEIWINSISNMEEEEQFSKYKKHKYDNIRKQGKT